MTYLIFLEISIALLAVFFGLTMIEARTGKRVLTSLRTKLDRQVGKIFFIIGHVNWSEFTAHLLQSVVARIVHDVAHWSLIAVRFAERQLTQVVRYLRDKRPNLLAPTPSRKSVLSQTMSYLRETFHVSPPKKRNRNE